MEGFSEDRRLTIASASRVLAMLVVDKASPGSDLWEILRKAGAGSHVSPQRYGVELVAFSAHVICAAFSIYTGGLGSFVSHKSHDFLINTIKDVELSLLIQDRGGEYNIAGWITAATPEEDWTLDNLVKEFWNNVSPSQPLSEGVAVALENWVRFELDVGKRLFPTITVVPNEVNSESSH